MAEILCGHTNKPHAGKGMCQHCYDKHRHTPERKYGKRQAWLRRLYGITIEEYDYIKTQQNGLCKICGKDKSLVVDHHHATGKIRGLLCNSCNTMIGLANESDAILGEAIRYLRMA